MGVPAVNTEAKRRLEENFWSHLSNRYPLTRWWWGNSRDAAVSLFPEWSAQAFEREAAEWRRLAQDSVLLDEAESRHWGRFARLAATRLSLGSFEDAAEPLRHANTVLTVVELIDSSAERYPRESLVDSAAEWLARIADVRAHSFWREVRVRSEGARLRHLILHTKPSPDADPAVFSAKQQNVLSVLEEYLTRVTEGREADLEPVPWVASAHVSVEAWRRERRKMSVEPPLVIHRPLAGDAILNPDQPRAPRIQEVVIPGLRQWWVRPDPEGEGDMVFHGDRRDASMALATVLALWRQQSKWSRLTWALTPPPHAEGGLASVCRLLEGLWPAWESTQSRFLAQWVQRRRAMAVADAWLWLEGGDPALALPWLSRFLPKHEALAVIPWMKGQPGYYVMSHRVFEVLSSPPSGQGWDHWVLTQGPIMPDALFLSPEQFTRGAKPVPHERA